MSHHGTCQHDDPQMCGCRARTQTGRMRKVRNDKTAKHIEQQYNVDIFGRSDQKLKSLMKRFHVSSQSQLLEKLKKGF